MAFVLNLGVDRGVPYVYDTANHRYGDVERSYETGVDPNDCKSRTADEHGSD